MSFATPYGYQTNLLILSAGGYKFTDFLRVGIPLTIIMWVGFSLVLPALYSLYPGIDAISTVTVDRGGTAGNTPGHERSAQQGLVVAALVGEGCWPTVS